MKTPLTEPQGKIKNPIIICEDVHKWFDDFHVLKGITTSFEKGERAVICGPSGSGKSTFIRTLNRLEEHQRGTIVIDGVELSDDLRNINLIRQEVGMVFQQFNLFPHLTNLQNITLGPIRVRKMTRSEAEEVALSLFRTGWILRIRHTSILQKFRAVNNSGSQSHGHWRWSLRLCFSMNRQVPWIRK